MTVGKICVQGARIESRLHSELDPESEDEAMVGVTIHEEVRAEPGRVFEVFTDLRSAPERVEGIESLEVLSEGPIGQGTRFRETRVMFGKQATEEMEITGWVPGKSYVVEADSHGSHYRTEFVFEPAGMDATRVTMHFEATPHSLVAKLMAPLGKMMLKQVQKLCAKDMQDLKAHIERGA